MVPRTRPQVVFGTWWEKLLPWRVKIIIDLKSSFKKRLIEIHLMFFL